MYISFLWRSFYRINISNTREVLFHSPSIGHWKWSLEKCIWYGNNASKWRPSWTKSAQKYVLRDRINSSPPSAAYMHQWTGSALVQEMACRLFGAKPLPEPMLACCQLDSWEQISVKFESEFYHLYKKKMHLKLSFANMAAILSRGRWVE